MTVAPLLRPAADSAFQFRTYFPRIAYKKVFNSVLIILAFDAIFKHKDFHVKEVCAVLNRIQCELI